MQHIVFTMHLRSLTANTIKVELVFHSDRVSSLLTYSMVQSPS